MQTASTPKSYSLIQVKLLLASSRTILSGVVTILMLVTDRSRRIF